MGDYGGVGGGERLTTVRARPALSLLLRPVPVHLCEAVLLAQLQLFRRLITMVKTREPTESERAAPAVAQDQAETEGGGAAARLAQVLLLRLRRLREAPPRLVLVRVERAVAQRLRQRRV